jgi:uncharacterized protein (DUF362 family)
MLNRREFLRCASAASFAPFLSACQRSQWWDTTAYRKPQRSRVAILQARDYGAALTETVSRGIGLFRLNVRGKRVVLKPNLVEYDPRGVINTHPAVIHAAIEAFRKLGAAEVVVAEGPGHRRDNEYLLQGSGLREVIKDTRAPYIDLNYDNLKQVRLPSRLSSLGSLYLPETVLDADLLVSMPKLKTHHWAGVTLSLKNMFGVVPGSVYGWPKNILHWAGLQECIVDINAALGLPRFNIVDGIVGMEGNGPIQGEAKSCGVLVFGSDPVAVDATAARLMGVDPRKIRYLQRAAEFLGNIEEPSIEQAGEMLDSFRQKFRLIESFQHISAA